MPDSLISVNVDWCDSETFLILLQHVEIYRNVIHLFEL